MFLSSISHFFKGTASSSALCAPLKESFRHNAALCTVRDRHWGKVREKLAKRSGTIAKGKDHLFVYKVVGEDRQTHVGPRAAYADMVNGL